MSRARKRRTTATRDPLPSPPPPSYAEEIAAHPGKRIGQGGTTQTNGHPLDPSWHVARFALQDRDGMQTLASHKREGWSVTLELSAPPRRWVLTARKPHRVLAQADGRTSLPATAPLMQGSADVTVWCFDGNYVVVAWPI